VDPEDVTVIDTALRETEEEIGLQKDQVEIWTVLNPLPENVGCFCIMKRIL